MLKYQTHLIVVSVASSVFNDTTSDPKQIPTATQIKLIAGCVSIPDLFALKIKLLFAKFNISFNKI